MRSSDYGRLPNQGIDCRKELVLCERFGQVAIKSCRHDAFHVPSHGHGGDREKRRTRQKAVRPNCLGHRQPVYYRELDVEDDHVRQLPSGHVEGHLSISRLNYDASCNLEKIADEKSVHLMHRVIGGDVDGWITQGDNTQAPDNWTPSNREVLGVAKFHIPIGGRVLAVMRSWLVIAAFGGLAVGLMVWPNSRKAKEEKAAAPAKRGRHKTRRTSRARLA